ncbi:MAG: DUF6580 family putative transport protein [Bacillota bacterium]|nr:DUF6580 family putative transport protein [Bacillota bacterium]
MKNRYLVVVLCIAVLLLASIIPENPLYRINWALLVTIIIGIIILSSFWFFEKSEMNTIQIALIATTASLAAISRVVFAGIVNVQPATFIIMITGYIFGPQTGFMVGAVCALVSNFFLGQGPWTPWQMFAWGICGVLGAIMGGSQREYKNISFAIFAGVCGYIFGLIMNLWHWIAFVYPLTWKTFLATYAVSLPFDTLHAVGNVVFVVIFGKAFYTILLRFKKYV